MTVMRTLIASGLALLAATAAEPAHAAFPDRPVHLIVPFDPGGSTDVLARLIGQKLSGVLGQQVVVDNRPGAGGTLGTDETSRARPDGYTMLLINALAHTASVHFYPSIRYDAVKSFTAIGPIGDVNYMLIVNPELPAKDYKAFVELMRSAPGKYNAASAGIGTAPHLALELFKRTTKLDITHIPYKGSGQALNDMVAGFVSIEFENIAAAQLIKGGKLRALAITGSHRAEAFPDLPTFAEAGQPDFDVTAHWGLVAPAGVPADAVQALSDGLAKVLADPALRDQLKAQGIDPQPGPAATFAATLSSESEKWTRLVKEAGLKP